MILHVNDKKIWVPELNAGPFKSFEKWFAKQNIEMKKEISDTTLFMEHRCFEVVCDENNTLVDVKFWPIAGVA